MPALSKVAANFLENLLSHSAELSGKTASRLRSEMSDRRFRQLVDTVSAMSDDKLRLADFVSREEHKRILREYPSMEGSAYATSTTWGSPRKGMIAIPGENISIVGPDAVPHELRHVQQETTHSIDPSYLRADIPYGDMGYHVPLKYGVAEDEYFFGKGAIPMGKSHMLKPLHPKLSDIEVDATLSAAATLEKANILSQLAEEPTSIGREFKKIKEIWDRLHPEIKKHYWKTTGVAAPTMTAFEQMAEGTDYEQQN